MRHAIWHLTLFITLACTITAAMQAQYAVNRYVFGVGGTETKNAENRIIGTLGQALIGVTQNTAYTNHVGFWYNVQSVPVGVTHEAVLPSTLNLGQNYPNPVDGPATIPFTLKHKGFVRLSVLNVLGEEVQTLIAEEMLPGAYHVTLDVTDLPGGIYLYRLQDGKHSITRRFVVRK